MNKSSYLILDIETRPMSLDRIQSMGLVPPFKAGNLKDPEKLKKAEKEWPEESMEKAALDATRSEVCAVGFGFNESNAEAHFDEEDHLIALVWDRVKRVINESGRIIGFGLYNFDLPYLFRRSWILGITPPDSLRSGRYWNQAHIVDLADIWKLGVYDDYISLDRACKSVGLKGKERSGKDYYKLLESDPEKAREYLLNDITQTEALARKMGVI